VKNGLESKV